jgi:hypothetical protein
VNTPYPNSRPGPRYIVTALIALLALTVIVVTAKIDTSDHVRVALRSISVQTVQGETRPESVIPVPMPVPTPPAE